jgi:hypothetical protein
MKLNSEARVRILRFVFAMAIAAAVAAQIPTDGGSAMARDGYGGRGGGRSNGVSTTYGSIVSGYGSIVSGSIATPLVGSNSK